MIRNVKHITIYVRDQEEAARWYTEKLGFEKRADESPAPGVRWVVVAPKGESSPEFVLLKPGSFQSVVEPQQMLSQIGHQDMMVFETDDCRGDVEKLREKGVTIKSEPNDAPWGTQAVVEDLYGNDLVLIQSK